MAGLEDLKGFIPSGQALSSLGTSTISFLTYVVIGIVFIAIVGVILFIFLSSLKYNKKIIVWEKVGNHWQVTGRDKAMEMKFGKAGDTVYYLRKRKKTLPRPELQTGKRTYWFAIREDGEWINITMEDIDFAMKKAKAKFLHPEMRYARTSLLGSFKDRYDKQKFFDKYGHIIIPIIALAIICILVYFLFDKFVSLADKINLSMDASNKVLDKVNEVMQGLDRICSPSGVKPT